MIAFGNVMPADCRTAGREPSPYSTGNPDFLAVNSMFQTNAYALYNMKVYF